MSQQGQGQTQNQPGQVEITIARLYVKDLSYELPRAPQIFQQQYQPEMKVEVNVTPKNMGNNFFEVTLNVLLDAKVGNESIFMVEIEQAGIFEIKNTTPQQLDHILLVFCPQTLFPYARTHIDQAMTMGSLPPIMLAPINFEAMRNQREAKPTQGGVN
jgi:preprotein translocase subunit SecB